MAFANARPPFPDDFMNVIEEYLHAMDAPQLLDDGDFFDESDGGAPQNPPYIQPGEDFSDYDDDDGVPDVLGRVLQDDDNSPYDSECFSNQIARGGGTIQ